MAADPGAALGLATAVLLGYLLYRGAVKINLAKFFTWTGAFLIVVAAGVLGYGVHDLQEAGILPGLNNLAFDVSGTIDEGSWYGTVLKGVFNFSPQTTVLQAVVWMLYLVVTMTFFLRGVRRRGRAAGPGCAASPRQAARLTSRPAPNRPTRTERKSTRCASSCPWPPWSPCPPSPPARRTAPTGSAGGRAARSRSRRPTTRCDAAPPTPAPPAT